MVGEENCCNQCSNIYAEAAYVSQKVSREILIKKENIYIDSQTLLTTAVANVIMQLHVMTGCDHNCGFYGRYEKLQSKSSVT